jgi:imidazole glycerol-phosphate synthase subunit HisF
MLTSRIIPCLDVRDGRVVKGVRFSALRDAGDPVRCAIAYQSQGADELVILDVSATPEGRRANLDTVSAVRADLGIPITVGGGVRSIDDAAALLSAGADKVGVNTAAVEDRTLVSRLAGRFGSQCVVVAVDAARRDGSWAVVVRSGRERTRLDAVRRSVEAAALGAGELLLTSWDRDGTGSGYDLDLIRSIRARVGIPIIASGGASCADDVAAALHAGADAALAASVFHEARTTVAGVKRALVARGLEIRT